MDPDLDDIFYVHLFFCCMEFDKTSWPCSWNSDQKQYTKLPGLVLFVGLKLGIVQVIPVPPEGSTPLLRKFLDPPC